MRCTSNSKQVYKKRRRRNRKRELTIRLSCFVGVIVAMIVCGMVFLSSRNKVESYAAESYEDSVYCSKLFADNLCVTNEEVAFEEFYRHDEFHGALLFDLNNDEAIYAEHIHERLFPASTTKIMTAYLALKYGDLTQTVVVSDVAVDVPSDSSTAGLHLGDRLTLEDLLYGLMLPSGNDSAVAIAECISGTKESFVELMNEEALKLGATNTHFVNPHGYQDKEHYTTAYDMYLIFKECIKYDKFLEIISATSWSTVITEQSGAGRSVTWRQTNQFVNGSRTVPDNIRVVGGKTGNTFDAGSCLLLYLFDEEETPYISIMMGASSRRNLYDNMTFLLSAINDRT